MSRNLQKNMHAPEIKWTNQQIRHILSTRTDDFETGQKSPI